MNYQNYRDFVLGEKFKFSHHEENLNYDMFTKGRDWKLIIFYGDDAEHFYDVPRFWLIKNTIAKFEGFIDKEEDFKLICKLVNVQN